MSSKSGKQHIVMFLLLTVWSTSCLMSVKLGKLDETVNVTYAD